MALTRIHGGYHVCNWRFSQDGIRHKGRTRAVSSGHNGKTVISFEPAVQTRDKIQLTVRLTGLEAWCCSAQDRNRYSPELSGLRQSSTSRPAARSAVNHVARCDRDPVTVDWPHPMQVLIGRNSKGRSWHDSPLEPIKRSHRRCASCRSGKDNIASKSIGRSGQGRCGLHTATSCSSVRRATWFPGAF